MFHNKLLKSGFSCFLVCLFVVILSSVAYASKPPINDYKCSFDFSCVGIIEKDPSGQGKEVNKSRWRPFCINKKNSDKYIKTPSKHLYFLDETIPCKCSQSQLCQTDEDYQQTIIFKIKRLLINLINLI